MDQHGIDVPEVERVIPRAPEGGWPATPRQDELRGNPGDASLAELRFDLPRLDPKVLEQLRRHGGGHVILLDPERPERKYLPTFAELVDRMTIVQLKQIWIPQHAAEYAAEIALIEHDLDILLEERKITARHVRAIAVLMLTNRVIWESESKARRGEGATLEDLTFTHSINGVRNTTKNILSEMNGERKDWKIDALAESLPERFGNWDIFK